MVEFIGTNFISNMDIIEDERYRAEIIKLSERITIELDKLPIGSKVGIECTKELIENFSDDVSDSISSIQVINKENRFNYWSIVIAECKQRDLDVIFLADNDDYKKLKEESEEWTYFDELQQGVELGFAKIEKFKIETGDGQVVEKDPWDLEELHKNRFYYWKFIKVPDNIFQKVKEFNPDLVILSKQTLDYFVMKRPTIVDYSEIEIRGIKIEEIEKEVKTKTTENGFTTINKSIKSKLVEYDLDNYPSHEKYKFEYGYKNGDRQTVIDKYLATSDIQDRSFED